MGILKLRFKETNKEIRIVSEPARVFQNYNDVYASNTILVEKDTRQIKLGDGKTRYNNLPVIFNKPGIEYRRMVSCC